MTIGPAPMMRTLLMSVRLGTLAHPPSSSRSDRTGSRCRAARDSPRDVPGSRTPAGRCARGPAGLPSKSETCVASRFAGSVAGSTAKPWFWLVMTTVPRLQVLHRVVGAVVAELHLHGLRARGEAHELVARGRCRTVGIARVEDFADRVGWRSRRARGRPGRWTGTRRRASAQSTSAAGVCAGRTVTRAAALDQHAQDVALDAVVVGRDAKARRAPLPRSRSRSATVLRSTRRASPVVTTFARSIPARPGKRARRRERARDVVRAREQGAVLRALLREGCGSGAACRCRRSPARRSRRGNR